MAKRDAVVFGVRAALAVGRYRPDSILRVLFTEEHKKRLGSLLKAAAARRKPYRIVESADLDRICGTPHHEGVVVIASPFHLPSLEDSENTVLGRKIIVLDDVTNPHNVGAVVRSAAWFGFDAVVLHTDQPFLNPAAIRVSQGGVFAMECFRVRRLDRWLNHFRENEGTVIGLTQTGDTQLQGVQISGKYCLVFGNERDGISDSTLAICQRKIRIAGSDAVESLNISVAAGIAMAQFAQTDF